MGSKLSRRAFLTAAGTALAGAALAACGATPTPTPAPAKATATPVPPTATPAPKSVELRVIWWGSQDRHDRTIKVIDLFQKKYPNIKMTYEFVAWADYWTKANTQAAGGNLPDLMQHDYAYIAEWTTRGLVIALDDLVKSGALDLSDVSPELLDPGRIGGKLMAVNLGSNSQCWNLDVDAFKKAGVDLPSSTWTWTDLENLAIALHNKLGIWGMGSGLGDEQLWGAVYLSLGQWRYSADGTKIGYTDDKPWIDYLNMMLRLEKAGAIPTRAEDLANYRGKSVEMQPIVPGKAAMGYHWSNQLVAVWKAAGDNRNLKLHPLPRVTGGKSANYIKASMFWSITAHSKNPKEAAMFIDYFTNSTEANDILFAERGVPIAAKVRDYLKPKLGRSQVEMFDFVTNVAKDVQPCPPPDPPGHLDIVNNVLHPMVIDPVMFGKLAPDKAAALLREEANKILAAQKK